MNISATKLYRMVTDPIPEENTMTEEDTRELREAYLKYYGEGPEGRAEIIKKQGFRVPAPKGMEEAVSEDGAPICAGCGSDKLDFNEAQGELACLDCGVCGRSCACRKMRAQWGIDIAGIGVWCACGSYQ